MFYLVDLESEVGKKLLEFILRKDDIDNKFKKFAKDNGLTTEYFKHPMLFAGGFDLGVIPQKVDDTLWKGSDAAGYTPKKNSSWGRDMDKKLKRLGRIQMDDVSKAVGWDIHGVPGFWINIHLCYTAKNDIIGFHLSDKAHDVYKAPEGVKEVTSEEFKKYFKIV